MLRGRHCSCSCWRWWDDRPGRVKLVRESVRGCSAQWTETDDLTDSSMCSVQWRRGRWSIAYKHSVATRRCNRMNSVAHCSCRHRLDTLKHSTPRLLLLPLRRSSANCLSELARACIIPSAFGWLHTSWISIIIFQIRSSMPDWTGWDR